MLKRSFSLKALMLAIPLILVACYGRPHLESQLLSPDQFSDLGFKNGMPSVVVFSALWCHPCREEIETVNQAAREFQGLIQFGGYLVEGEEKGSPVQDADLANFKSFNGVSPSYPVALDTNWVKFDAKKFPQGRALPAMMIIDRSGNYRAIQQSLDYNTQLRPILVSLSQGGSAVPPVESPSPTPAPGLQQLSDKVANWLTRAEVVAHPDLQKNLTDSWSAGLLKYDFDDQEMPLGDGQISFAWDGKDQNIPQVVNWKAITDTSVCKLQINLKPDATVSSMSGSCRPK
jgi:thiol-disulfide isomerase/thioredoxin